MLFGLPFYSSSRKGFLTGLFCAMVFFVGACKTLYIPAWSTYFTHPVFSLNTTPSQANHFSNFLFRLPPFFFLESRGTSCSYRAVVALRFLRLWPPGITLISESTHFTFFLAPQTN